jgi:hypothetical protein
MPPASGTYRQQTTMAMPAYQPGQGMMMNVGQYPPCAGKVPMMQMGQQPTAAPMMMNYYAPNQQPNKQPGYFWQAGVGSNKLVTSVNKNCCPTPTHNYTLAASILLKTINVDATTIKGWAILDSGAISHFLTTNALATNIVLAAVPLIARLPNGDKVQSTHTCTLNLPDLPAGAQATHIIPGLASLLLLSVVTMYNTGCMVTFTKINCTISYCGWSIIYGNKCTCIGLWMVLPIKNARDQSVSPSATTNHAPFITPPTAALAANVDATSSTA